jgi:hypothetical protein
MVTKIKDSATAQEAALKLNQGVEVPVMPGEPPAPKEKTTAEKLFPEFITDDGGIINRPVKSYEEKSKSLLAVVTPAPEPQGQKPPTIQPTVPVYLKPEELTGKMVKLKVDGIEQDVPAETLIKTTQLERHLNAQLMNLAQERKSLEDEKRRIQSMPPPVPEVKKIPEPSKKGSEMEALEAHIAQMQAEMVALQRTMIPAIQEAGIKRVEKMVKDKIGSEDFRTYFDKIRDSALEQMANPDVANDANARRYYDSDAYYFEKYKEMKLKELMTKPSTPAPSPNAPVLVTPQGSPVVLTNSGQPVSIPAFESSSGVPSREGLNGNWAARAQSAFDNARQTGRTEDWVAYYKLKSEASS